MNHEQLAQIAKNKGYGTSRRHIFLCVNDKCAKSERALELWEFLKRRLHEQEPETKNATVLRSKVGCLRICANGPVALVYPEGTLYAELDEEKLERIIDEHLFNGKPVEAFSFFQKPLVP